MRRSCGKTERPREPLLQLRRIFTAISTSLSLGSRQWGQRYAIRAGRNLPDKEFRYLRHGVSLMSPPRSDYIFTTHGEWVWRVVSEDSTNLRWKSFLLIDCTARIVTTSFGDVVPADTQLFQHLAKF